MGAAAAAATPGEAAASDSPTRDAPTDVEDVDVDRLYDEWVEECRLSGDLPQQLTPAEDAWVERLLAGDDDDGGWFSCSEDENNQEEEEEEEEVQRQEKGKHEEKVDEDAQAATTFPPAVGPFALPTGSTGAPQQEQGDEGEEQQKVKAWLASYRLSHVWDSLRGVGVKTLEDLALDAEDEDIGQLALRSTFEARRFRRAPQDLRTSMSTLRTSTEQGGGTVERVTNCGGGLEEEQARDT